MPGPDHPLPLPRTADELTPRTHTTFVLDLTFGFLTALLIQLPLWRAGRAQSKLDAGVPAE